MHKIMEVLNMKRIEGGGRGRQMVEGGMVVWIFLRTFLSSTNPAFLQTKKLWRRKEMMKEESFAAAVEMKI